LDDFGSVPQVAKTVDQFQQWVDFDRDIGRHVNLGYLEVEAGLFLSAC
jgi:hypothetical protein